MSKKTDVAMHRGSTQTALDVKFINSNRGRVVGDCVQHEGWSQSDSAGARLNRHAVHDSHTALGLLINKTHDCSIVCTRGNVSGKMHPCI